MGCTCQSLELGQTPGRQPMRPGRLTTIGPRPRHRHLATDTAGAYEHRVPAPTLDEQHLQPLPTQRMERMRDDNRTQVITGRRGTMSPPSGSTAAASRCCPASGSTPAAPATAATCRPSDHRPVHRAAGNPVLLDRFQGGLIDARRAVVAAHRDPRPPHDVPAVNLVTQRVKPPFRVGLGRPVKRMLQGTDRVHHIGPHRGGTSHVRHSPGPSSPVDTRERSSGPSLTAGCVVPRLDRYYDRLRLPPGAPSTSRLLTGYRTTLVHENRSPLRPGRVSPVPAATI